MWSPTLHHEGEGRRRQDRGNSWNRLSHERSNLAGHRGNDDGMSVNGDQRNTGNPCGEGV
jgi:hypothetical protein